jgi:hypothetical protein
MRKGHTTVQVIMGERGWLEKSQKYEFCRACEYTKTRSTAEGTERLTKIPELSVMVTGGREGQRVGHGHIQAIENLMQEVSIERERRQGPTYHPIIHKQMSLFKSKGD